jgi:hypothetical protein
MIHDAINLESNLLNDYDLSTRSFSAQLAGYKL